MAGTSNKEIGAIMGHSKEYIRKKKCLLKKELQLKLYEDDDYRNLMNS